MSAWFPVYVFCHCLCLSVHPYFQWMYRIGILSGQYLWDCYDSIVQLGHMLQVVERTKQQFADALQTYYSEGKGGLPAEQLQPYAEGCVIGPYPDTAEQFAAVEAINKEEEEKVSV